MNKLTAFVTKFVSKLAINEKKDVSLQTYLYNRAISQFISIMCKISISTIKRANLRAKPHRPVVDVQSQERDSIIASTIFNGKVYKQEIPMKRMRQAYARALGTIRDNNYGGNI